MYRQGLWLHLGRLFGQPVAVHLSLPLGLLFFTNMRFAPGAWVGIILLVLMHELGHGVLVKLRGGRVTGITLHGLGGECAYTGARGELDRAIIAWGGVIAQALAIPILYTVLVLVELPETRFTLDFASTLLHTNLIMIVMNLLPVPPLDGATAWTLIPLLRDRKKKPAPKTHWRR